MRVYADGHNVSDWKVARDNLAQMHCIYIYIYIERERYRDVYIDMHTHYITTCVYIYIYGRQVDQQATAEL